MFEVFNKIFINDNDNSLYSCIRKNYWLHSDGKISKNMEQYMGMADSHVDIAC